MSLKRQRDILRQIAADDYRESSRQERKMTVIEIVAFIRKIRQGV